jgi:hypothetical protein
MAKEPRFSLDGKPPNLLSIKIASAKRQAKIEIAPRLREKLHQI